VGWSVKIYVLKTISVMVYHFIQTIDSGVKNVTIHRKAVSSTLAKGRHSAAEAVKVYELVTVVVLKNPTHRLNHLQVLIFLRIEIVQR